MRRLSLLLLVLLAGCARSRPPVIVISIDTLRADHLPAGGAIAALQKDGVTFENAWSHCPMTLPSHVSMLTGLLPTEHGVRNNVGFTFRPNRHRTIAQTLKEDGYATAGFVSAFVLRGRTGLASAFDHYDDVDETGRADSALDLERAGAETVDRAIAWLPDSPFFLFVHLFEPHHPYVNGYDGEIATADAAIGRLIDALKKKGIYDDALIILTSDHGEGLGDHGEMQHSVLLYSEVLRVPMIVKLPRAERAGTHLAHPVQHADIAATIASVTKTTFGKGRSLFDAAPRTIYSETLFPRIHLGWSELTSVVDATHHLIGGPKPELYDVRSDPRETRNIMEQARRDASRLRERLQAFQTAIPPAEAVDAETAASLAALGYVGSSSRPGTLLNPRDHIAEYEAMRQDLADLAALAADPSKARDIAARPDASAAALLVAARVTNSLALFDRAEAKAKASKKWPMPGFDLARGNALVAANRHEEALRAFERETRHFPDNLNAFAALAMLQFAMGGDGGATLEQMVEKNPTEQARELARKTRAAVAE
jgi:hypothetical protein